MTHSPTTPFPSEPPDARLIRFAEVLRRFRPETAEDALMSVALSLNRTIGALGPHAGQPGDLHALLAIRRSVDRVVEESGLARRVPTAFGAPPAHAGAGNGTVLLVDDATDVLVTLGAFLEGAGFEVLKATGADAALRILSVTPAIAAVVTDVAMPGMSGVDLVQQVLELRPGLPVAIATAYADIALLASIPPTIRVLRKPFRRAELVNCVLEMVQPAHTAPVN